MGGGVLLGDLVLDEAVNAVQCDPAVIADDTSAAVSVRKTGNDVGGTAVSHLLGVSVKYTGIVGLSVDGEKLNNFRIQLIAVVLARLHGHTDSAVRHHGTFERLVCLETNDGLFIFVQIPCCVRGDGRYHLGIHIQHAACLPFLTGKIQHLVP